VDLLVVRRRTQLHPAGVLAERRRSQSRVMRMCAADVRPRLASCSNSRGRSPTRADLEAGTKHYGGTVTRKKSRMDQTSQPKGSLGAYPPILTWLME
jgi:hypothetical protein